jgi:predicted nucleic acid-binding protein
MTVADTEVLIDYLAGKGEADAVERLLRVGALKTTVISRFEILSGAQNPKQLARPVRLLAAIPSLER